MDKTVSILIPTYNRKNTLKKVIYSYLKQKHVHELIFVDDGSGDGTYEYLQEQAKLYPMIHIMRHDKNLGVSASRNDGLDRVTGNYILFGEDDLCLNDDYVSTLMDCMEQSRADMIAGRILYSRPGEAFSETVNRCNQYKGPLINFWLMSGFYLKYTADHQEMPFLHAISLAKAEVCKRIRFDTSFFAREETDFYLRTCEEGFRIVFCPHTFCVHLPRDKGKGGGWKVGLLKYQYLATRNNNMLVDRHYTLLKGWGMRGNKTTFKLLHLLNRVRIVYLYFRFSTRLNYGSTERSPAPGI